MTLSKYKQLKWLQLWMMVGYGIVFTLIFYSLHPRPPDVSSISFGDKLVHFSAYFFMCLWFAQLYQRTFQWKTVLGLILLGALIEVVQGFTDYRSFEFADMLANTTGVVIAWLIAETKLGYLLIKFEEKFFK